MVVRNNSGLGHVLRTYRRDRRQLDVAAAAGISRSYLSELETGVHPHPPRHILERLAEALDIDPVVLFTAGGLRVGSGEVPGPRAEFADFVNSEPTLTSREARAAVLAVYYAVADLDEL